VLLFTWPYNFDVSCKTTKSSQGMCQVFHLARYAVSFNSIWLEIEVHLTQSKILCCWWHGLH